MGGLQKLKMIGDLLNDDGLYCILESCPRLEIIYIRNCHYLKIGEMLKTKLDKIQLKYYNYFFNMYVDYDDDYDKHGVSDYFEYSDYASDSDYSDDDNEVYGDSDDDNDIYEDSDDDNEVYGDSDEDNDVDGDLDDV